MVKKEYGLQMVWILNGIWNPGAWPFEIKTNSSHFVKKMSEPQIVCFWMVGTIAVAKAQPFENKTWNPILKKYGFQIFQISSGRISDPHCNRI